MRQYMKILNERLHLEPAPSFVSKVEFWFHKIGELLAEGVERGDINEPIEFQDNDVVKEEGGHWVAKLSFHFVPDNAEHYRGRHHKDEPPNQFHEEDKPKDQG